MSNYAPLVPIPDEIRQAARAELERRALERGQAAGLDAAEIRAVLDLKAALVPAETSLIEMCESLIKTISEDSLILSKFEQLYSACGLSPKGVFQAERTILENRKVMPGEVLAVGDLLALNAAIYDLAARESSTLTAPVPKPTRLSGGGVMNEPK